MYITYKTNGAITTKSMTEWYFGKKFVAKCTKEAKATAKATGFSEIGFWQNGTGTLTVEIG